MPPISTDAEYLYLSRYRRNELKFPLAELIFLEGDGNYSQLHMQNGSIHLSSFTLRLFEAALPVFVRSHRAYLVNPQHIHDYDGMSLTLTTGREVPVARRRRALFKPLKANSNTRLLFGRGLTTSRRVSSLLDAFSNNG